MGKIDNMEENLSFLSFYSFFLYELKKGEIIRKVTIWQNEKFMNWRFYFLKMSILNLAAGI